MLCEMARDATDDVLADALWTNYHEYVRIAEGNEWVAVDHAVAGESPVVRADSPLSDLRITVTLPAQYMENTNGISIGTECSQALWAPDRPIRLFVSTCQPTRAPKSGRRVIASCLSCSATAARIRKRAGTNDCIKVAKLESERIGSMFLDAYDPSEWCIP